MVFCFLQLAFLFDLSATTWPKVVSGGLLGLKVPVFLSLLMEVQEFTWTEGPSFQFLIDLNWHV